MSVKLNFPVLSAISPASVMSANQRTKEMRKPITSVALRIHQYQILKIYSKLLLMWLKETSQCVRALEMKILVFQPSSIPKVLYKGKYASKQFQIIYRVSVRCRNMPGSEKKGGSPKGREIIHFQNRLLGSQQISLQEECNQAGLGFIGTFS